jgi:hypothetical protein
MARTGKVELCGIFGHGTGMEGTAKAESNTSEF